MSIKTALTDHPIHPLLSERWSPYAFAERAVPEADLLARFEAGLRNARRSSISCLSVLSYRDHLLTGIDQKNNNTPVLKA